MTFRRLLNSPERAHTWPNNIGQPCGAARRSQRYMPRYVPSRPAPVRCPSVSCPSPVHRCPRCRTALAAACLNIVEAAGRARRGTARERAGAGATKGHGRMPRATRLHRRRVEARYAPLSRLSCTRLVATWRQSSAHQRLTKAAQQHSSGTQQSGPPRRRRGNGPSPQGGRLSPRQGTASPEGEGRLSTASLRQRRRAAMRWLVGWSSAAPGRGRYAPGSLEPVGAQLLWSDPDPLWAVGDWRPDEVRVVEADAANRLAVFGCCGASDEELRLGLSAARGGAYRHLTAWPGSYTAVACVGRRLTLAADLAPRLPHALGRRHRLRHRGPPARRPHRGTARHRSPRRAARLPRRPRGPGGRHALRGGAARTARPRADPARREP
jgi:hypothetical protein